MSSPFSLSDVPSPVVVRTSSLTVAVIWPPSPSLSESCQPATNWPPRMPETADLTSLANELSSTITAAETVHRDRVAVLVEDAAVDVLVHPGLKGLVQETTMKPLSSTAMSGSEFVFRIAREVHMPDGIHDLAVRPMMASEMPTSSSPQPLSV